MKKQLMCSLGLWATVALGTANSSDPVSVIPSQTPNLQPIPSVAPKATELPAVQQPPNGVAPSPAKIVQPGTPKSPNGTGPDATGNGTGAGGGTAKPVGEPEKPKEPKFGLLFNDLKPSGDKSTFFKRLYGAYYDEFFPPENQPEEPEQPRKALPSPWPSPPFPNSEFQGYPLIGVPNSTKVYPVMKSIYGAETPLTDAIRESRIKFDGWATMFATASPAKSSNVPASYWIVPNRADLDQLVFRLERLPDTVQQDHIDWGFRSIALYGVDYRYTTAGGWGSDQLLEHNKLRGWDPVEQYVDVYVPGFLGGTMVRVGRWIACPDIESQYAPDNYLGSHSILFTYDTYTQTGVMVTQKLSDQWSVQAVAHSGTDMAPWYKGSVLSGAFGFRWVSEDNHDAVYAWLNSVNSAEFRHFNQYGQPLGHDNFNYVVATYEHSIRKEIITKTEGYYMWQYNAEVGGTPSAGPTAPYGGGGGDGVRLNGLSRAYGLLNYTMFGLTDRDYVTVRNEIYRDERGMRTGFAGTYSSHTIGLSHQFSDVLMIRPEAGYYRNYHQGAFDNGNNRGTWIIGFDLTYHF